MPLLGAQTGIEPAREAGGLGRPEIAARQCCPDLLYKHAAPVAAYAPRTGEDRSARPGRGRRPAAGIAAAAAATARAGGGTTPCRLPGFSERPAASPCAAADWGCRAAAPGDCRTGPGRTGRSCRGSSPGPDRRRRIAKDQEQAIDFARFRFRNAAKSSQKQANRQSFPAFSEFGARGRGTSVWIYVLVMFTSRVCRLKLLGHSGFI